MHSYLSHFYHHGLMLGYVGLIEMVRYLLIAGGAAALFYGFFRQRWVHRKIVEKFPAYRDMWREFVLSMMSCVVYAIVGLLSFVLIPPGWNHYYLHISDYGIVWFVISIILTIILHDAYFYWTHRLMHVRSIYRVMHKAHHLSTNPTPWAAYAFDPLEAFVQAGIFPLVCILYPIHPLANIIFMGFQTTFNVMGHTGYEIFPSWFLKSWLGKIMNTSTNHAMHHQYFRGNYGLYFNIWDRLMGTNHPEYERRFEEVTTRPRPPKNVPQPATRPVSEEQTVLSQRA